MMARNDLEPHSVTVSVPIVCTTLVEILCSASGSTLTSATRPPMKIPEYIV